MEWRERKEKYMVKRYWVLSLRFWVGHTHTRYRKKKWEVEWESGILIFGDFKPFFQKWEMENVF